jgi:hypothetical protein
VRVLLVIAVVAVLAGCAPSRPWGEVTPVDRARYEVLLADPVWAGVGAPAHGAPGEYRDWLLARGSVSASVIGLTDAFRSRGLAALDAVERAGWTVYRTECVGGASTGPPLLWTAWAYKITDGVSYVLKLASATSSSTYPVAGEGAILIDGYAPHSDESPADLIGEHPPTVADPCPRADRPPAGTAVQGFDVIFGSGFNRNAGRRAGIR